MHAGASFDRTLIHRYDRNAPRYTSYPTALQFHPRFDVCAYRRAAILSNRAPARPLSAYIHVPFCASPCFYCGCNRVITRNPAHGEAYVRRLLREIEMQGALFDRRRVMRQVHFGGGTPTFLSTAQLATVVEQMGQSFTLTSPADLEMSIEIDPRTVTEETLPGLAMLGFNRLSIGVQDFDPRVQQAVNRQQSVELVRTALDTARVVGFSSVSFDLIYGLPLQTIDGFTRTIDTVIDLRPDRIAVYGYAHMPAMFKAQGAIDARTLPDAAARLDLLELAIRRLTTAGYVHIGMDHFALPTDELARALDAGTLHRNFQGYSTHADCDLVGLGVSAIGSVGGAYAQNLRDLAAYSQAIDEGRLAIARGYALSIDDLARREIVRRIMCGGVVARDAIEDEFALDFRSYFAAELVELRQMLVDGLLDAIDPVIRVSERGQYLLRSIAAVFDRYLPATPVRAYSKVV